MPAPVGPTMAIVCPASATSDQVVDERDVRQVAEGDVLEGDRAPDVGEPDRIAGFGDLLGLVEQLEDALGRGDRRLEDVGDDAVWTIGKVNWREYWMNAMTSPRLIWPVATRTPPITAIAT